MTESVPSAEQLFKTTRECFDMIAEVIRSSAIPKKRKVNGKTLILANLTKCDFDHFYDARIPYSGEAADPHFDRDPRPWGKRAPYIATFLGELPRAVKAMKWEKFSVEIIDGQWIIAKGA